MVSDLLGTAWEILYKEEIEQTRCVNLNFLKYLSIKQSIKEFINNADKKRVNVGPNRPYMLNLAFSQKRYARTYIEKQVSMESKYFKKFPINGR